MLVDEDVVAVDQLDDGTVFGDEVREEHLGFAAHRLAHVVVELGLRIHDLVDVIRQPLGGGFVLVAPGLAQFTQRAFLARVANDDLARIHGDAFDIARLQPLAGEIAREIFRARVSQHALHLRGQLFA